MQIPCPKCGSLVPVENSEVATQAGCTNPDCLHVFWVNAKLPGSDASGTSLDLLPPRPPPLARRRQAVEAGRASDAKLASSPVPAAGAPRAACTPQLRSSRSCLGVLIALGVLAIVSLSACLAVAIAIDSPEPVPDWARHAVPQDATCLVRLRLEKLQGNDLYREFMKSLPRSATRFPGGLEAEDVAEAFAGLAAERLCIVARTREDLLLDDFIVDETSLSEFRNVEYAPVMPDAFPTGFLACTGDRLFSWAEDEDQLHELVDRWKRHSEPDVAPFLRQAISAVSTEDHYLGVMVNGPVDVAQDLAALGIGASLHPAHVNVRGVFVFRSDDSADRFVDNFQPIVDSWYREVRQSPTPLSQEARFAAERGLELLRQAKPRRRDNTVRFQGEWASEDLQEFVPWLSEIIEWF